jgi:hypothetical protein
MLNANCQNFPNKFITWTLRDGLSNIVKQQIAKKFNMQLLNSGVYYLESILPAEKGFCEVRKIDTLTVPSVKTPILNMGPDYSVCKGLELNISPEYFETFDAGGIAPNGVTFTANNYSPGTQPVCPFYYKVTKRVAPSISCSGNGTIRYATNTGIYLNAPLAVFHVSLNGFSISCGSAPAISFGFMDSFGNIYISAEL